MPHAALLPHGLPDLLPPDAAHEADVIAQLLAVFAGRGYERVKPPLVEFEDTLLAGTGADLADQTFRVMDPETRRMLAMRADMTPQIARLADSRLAKAPRPLRLSYSGQILRVKGTQLRPERQFTQVGAELFGSRSVGADAEVILMAAESLDALGLRNLSVDLNLPTLVPAIVGALDLEGDSATALRHALDRKDAAAVAAIGGRAAELCGLLLRATGEASRALSMLEKLELPAAAAAARDDLAEVVLRIKRAAPDLALTVDPVENRGFEYHSGVSFTLFARGVHGELGRGGRYVSHGSRREPATGFTLFMDSVLRALPEAVRSDRRLYIPAEEANGPLPGQLRAAGWVTICGFDPVADAAGEARRLECTHYLDKSGTPLPAGEN